MTIRKIQAKYATRENDHIIIIMRSNILECFFSGFFSGAVLSEFILRDQFFLLGGTPLDSAFISIAVGLFTGLYLTKFADSEVERYVPFEQVVEIKRYPWPAITTVVLDDERGYISPIINQPSNLFKIPFDQLCDIANALSQKGKLEGVLKTIGVSISFL